MWHKNVYNGRWVSNILEDSVQMPKLEMISTIYASESGLVSFNLLDASSFFVENSQSQPVKYTMQLFTALSLVLLGQLNQCWPSETVKPGNGRFPVFQYLWISMQKLEQNTSTCVSVLCYSMGCSPSWLSLQYQPTCLWKWSRNVHGTALDWTLLSFISIWTGEPIYFIPSDNIHGNWTLVCYHNLDSFRWDGL